MFGEAIRRSARLFDVRRGYSTFGVQTRRAEFKRDVRLRVGFEAFESASSRLQGFKLASSRLQIGFILILMLMLILILIFIPTRKTIKIEIEMK